MSNSEKKYTQDGKTIKIIPLKRVKKTQPQGSEEEKEKPVKTAGRKQKQSAQKSGQAKFAVEDKVSLKNIPPEYAAAGFSESVVIKVFKSSYDQSYRYSIRSVAGHELAMLKEEQLKLRK